MFFTQLLSVCACSVLVAAQGYGYGAPSTPTTSAAASIPSAPPGNSTQINVDVFFNGQYIFNPQNFTASNGSFVTFYFPGGGIPHSVTQSSFADPCTYIGTSGSNNGFDSGLQMGKQFTIQITNDSQPIWFHCKAPLHCGMGMVGSINAPTSGDQTFDAFQAAAKKIAGNEVTETDNGPVTGGINAIATSTPTAQASTGSSAGQRITASSVVVFAGILSALVLVF